MKTCIDSFQRSYQTHTRWQDPLVGAVSAANAGFEQLKELVHSGHLMPEDVLPEAQSVVCFYLPFAKDVGRSNGSGPVCSDAWAYAYLETNHLIDEINQCLCSFFEKSGYKAAATPATHNFDPQLLLSNWSHRHIAVMAGLGSLGLNRMLITRKGCCGRLGSLATTWPVALESAPTMPGCLYFYDKSCQRCIQNCPVAALRENEFDRFQCYEHLLTNASVHSSKGFADVCGKCDSRIPCAFTNPVQKKREQGSVGK